MIHAYLRSPQTPHCLPAAECWEVQLQYRRLPCRFKPLQREVLIPRAGVMIGPRSVLTAGHVSACAQRVHSRCACCSQTASAASTSTHACTLPNIVCLQLRVLGMAEQVHTAPSSTHTHNHTPSNPQTNHSVSTAARARRGRTRSRSRPTGTGSRVTTRCRWVACPTPTPPHTSECTPQRPAQHPPAAVLTQSACSCTYVWQSASLSGIRTLCAYRFLTMCAAFSIIPRGFLQAADYSTALSFDLAVIQLAEDVGE